MLSEVLAFYLEKDELKLIEDALEYAKDNPFGAHKSKLALAKLAGMISSPPDELLIVMMQRRTKKNV